MNWYGIIPLKTRIQFSSVVSNSLRLHRLQHARAFCPPLSPRVCSDLCPLSQWCHPTISSSVIPFPFAFNLTQHQGLFQWVSSLHQVANESASVLLINIQDWFSLEFTGLIFLLTKGLSRVFSSTTVWKHQFFGTQLIYGPILTSIHDYWKKS